VIWEFLNLIYNALWLIVILGVVFLFGIVKVKWRDGT
jgi:hypothetical protein